MCWKANEEIYNFYVLRFFRFKSKHSQNFTSLCGQITVAEFRLATVAEFRPATVAEFRPVTVAEFRPTGTVTALTHSSDLGMR